MRPQTISTTILHTLCCIHFNIRKSICRLMHEYHFLFDYSFEHWIYLPFLFVFGPRSSIAIYFVFCFFFNFIFHAVVRMFVAFHRCRHSLLLLLFGTYYWWLWMSLLNIFNFCPCIFYKWKREKCSFNHTIIWVILRQQTQPIRYDHLWHNKFHWRTSTSVSFLFPKWNVYILHRKNEKSNPNQNQNEPTTCDDL